MPDALRYRQGIALRRQGPVRCQSTHGARPGLLHAHRVRGDGGRSRRAEHGRGGGAIRRAGRDDGRGERMGGAAVAGIGFAIGVDRMALAIQAAEKEPPRMPAVSIIAMGKAATPQANTVAQAFRSAGLNAELLSPERKVKSLLTRASKIGSDFVVIIGDDEVARGVVQIRDMKQSTQREVAVAEAVRAIADARKQ